MKARYRMVVYMLMLYLVLACSVAQFRPARQARVTATPTRTPRPTFTVTPLPTNTLPPTPTPLPTDTPTPTPLPTDTPLPTLTFAPPPSPAPTLPPPPTETPTARPTRKPTPKPSPTRVKPTNTPAPPFSGKITRGDARCDYAGVVGRVQHANGTPYPGVAVGVWSDAWGEGWISVTKDNGEYDVPLTGQPPGKYYVAVIRLETCPLRDGKPTVRDCEKRSNTVDFYITASCTGPQASWVTTVVWTGP